MNQLALRDRLTGEMYAETYRRCDNYPARVKQIELIVHILRQADDVVRFPITRTALKLAQAPAEKAGWREMYDSRRFQTSEVCETLEVWAYSR